LDAIYNQTQLLTETVNQNVLHVLLY